MSSLNGARMVFPLFPPPPLWSLLLSRSLSARVCSFSYVCVAVIRGNYEATDSSCLEEFRGAKRERVKESSTRGYIRLRRFLRSHSYPCGNDKTDGALLLKSHRVSRIRDAEIYESCRPAFSFSLFLSLLPHSSASFSPSAVRG